MSYGPDRFEETQCASITEALAAITDEAPGVTWIHVAGTHEIEGLQALGARFGLHPLTLEDVVNSGQRPKLENYDDHLFIVMRVIHSAAAVAGEQVSMYLGRSWVLTFEEIPEDAFDLVRERLRRGKGQIRSAGADYLAYSIVDAAVDHFFPVLETLGERIEALEEELVEDPDRRTLEKIHQLKRELLLIRRAAWPQREVISSLGRQESDLVHRETRVFLRDCYDHTIQIMDIVETYRDLASGMMDLYLSSVSHRTNEVMKVLTVIASIFIPLTFIAGIYGMNFNTKASPLNMPELNWYWGYPALWLVVIGLAAGMIVYFRRKRWI
jgi:magnesium transporter